MLPPTPGFTTNKSLTYLKYLVTPMQDKRSFKGLHKEEEKEPYLHKIAYTRKNEELKSPNNLQLNLNKNNMSLIKQIQKTIPENINPIIKNDVPVENSANLCTLTMKKRAVIREMSKRLIEDSINSIKINNSKRQSHK